MGGVRARPLFMDKAAAAIEIRAGHFSDPDDMPGLAHFAEHMLFLGTEPFPEESSFKEFLSKHGGQSNAFTGMEATGFHFSVQHTQLPSALERFASFFVAPSAISLAVAASSPARFFSASSSFSPSARVCDIGDRQHGARILQSVHKVPTFKRTCVLYDECDIRYNKNTRERIVSLGT